MSGEAIAGIVVGSVAGFLLLYGLALFALDFRRRRRRDGHIAELSEDHHMSEKSTDVVGELSGTSAKLAELPTFANMRPDSAVSTPGIVELDGGHIQDHEKAEIDHCGPISTNSSSYFVSDGQSP
jgi:hypothetical protein